MTSRILKKKEVLYRCGISNATLYRLIAADVFLSTPFIPGGPGRGLAGIRYRRMGEQPCANKSVASISLLYPPLLTDSYY